MPRTNQAAAGAGRALFNTALLDASMLFTDGPVHDRLRGPMRGVVGPSFINQLSVGVEHLCTNTVSVVPAGRTFDGDVSNHPFAARANRFSEMQPCRAR
ncbi:hypothetical protein ACNO8X_27225 [Mycobacterium sp. PDNC021]|uniref:hypothetical protein n=1 Tax=Mycobacterium sp. PDNC021 TaxID=3391399 RepID=UPI003AAFB112